ncbi:MAG: sugar-binding domain-containing protein [Bacteroidota bacterium]
MQRTDLNGVWHFKALTRRTGDHALRRWMKASVPGTVHTDLLANGKISDPFYRMQERDVQWVEEEDWVYRRDFRMSREMLREKWIELVAEGLDTIATVRVNGRLVGKSENMFVEHRFDIRKHLRAGKNRIQIQFDSPARHAKELERRHGQVQVSHSSERVYVRKAQYSFGWDWGPRLATSGIWRSIGIEAFSGPRLVDPFVRILSADAQRATLECRAEIRGRAGGRGVQARIEVSGPDNMGSRVSGRRWSATFLRRVKGQSFKVRFEIPHPSLWWPNGLGEQSLYAARIVLESNGQVQDSQDVTFAVRTVKIRQEKDAEGRSFVLEVNGTPVFCKGADWIPADTFLPRIPPGRYEKLLTMARDAHMNMIRVWGGGIYEQDIFYQQCDRLGLMVWQDFMFACAEYPELPAFHRNVREEVEKVVKRLRNHPSIVLWCGNNECEWLFCMTNPAKTPDQMRGARIFSKTIPALCASHDGTRPYWRSSPFGKGYPNEQTNGNHHQWDVWSGWKDFKEYENVRARFVTEFGFQSMADPRTMNPVTVRGDRAIQSPVMEFHNKQIEGTERLIRFQAAHYSLGRDYDEFVYKSQLVQAEALRCAVEQWRRRKFATAGALFWQLNDCWPVSSWAVIDSALRPKAAYYYAKRFNAPVLVSFGKTASGLDVWVTNDLRRPVGGSLSVQILSFDGKKLWHLRKNVKVSANSSRSILRIPRSRCEDADPSSHYLLAVLRTSRGGVAQNRYYLTEPKHLELGDPSVECAVVGCDGNIGLIELRSERLVKNLEIRAGGSADGFTDNYFDVDPGLARYVILRANDPARRLKKLSLRWLA